MALTTTRQSVSTGASAGPPGRRSVGDRQEPTSSRYGSALSVPKRRSTIRPTRREGRGLVVVPNTDEQPREESRIPLRRHHQSRHGLRKRNPVPGVAQRIHDRPFGRRKLGLGLRVPGSNAALPAPDADPDASRGTQTRSPWYSKLVTPRRHENLRGEEVLVGQAVVLECLASGDEVGLRRHDVNQLGKVDGDATCRVRDDGKVLADRDKPTGEPEAQ